MAKELWVHAAGEGDWNERKKIVTTALESGANVVVVNAGETSKVKELGNITVAAPDGDIKVVEDLNNVKKSDAFSKKIKNKDDEQEAAKAADKAGVVIVSTTDWTVIPLENLIAEIHKKKSRLIAEVESVEDAKLALGTLEIGVDGVLVKGDMKVIKEAAKMVGDIGEGKVGITVAKITEVKQVGMGDRVCIDACSLFEKGEGMLIGSQSNSLFLVHSETLESPYVAARPFRVNAGPVHAYALMPSGKTQYLSELKSGDEILAVDKSGVTRTLIVGRLKIEKRPLMMIEAEAKGKKFKTILQNAETIRLVSEDGKAVSVAELKKGDKVLVHLEEGGRHFGISVEESIEEK